jgi:hypothetical protein
VGFSLSDPRIPAAPGAPKMKVLKIHQKSRTKYNAPVFEMGILENIKHI